MDVVGRAQLRQRSAHAGHGNRPRCIPGALSQRASGSGVQRKQLVEQSTVKSGESKVKSRKTGDPVILSEAKNLRSFSPPQQTTGILRFAQNDRLFDSLTFGLLDFDF
ncbi:hypothetical protein SBA2_600005 [Acidobacteriia bacterium SbA2]|nr:hypothetical protein SBA2_600005 [Acidobacteriia bacterium SbA2]